MLYAFIFGSILWILGGILGLLMKAIGLEKPEGKTGVVGLSDLPSALLIGEPHDSEVLLVSIFRQSGNFERSFTCTDRTTAFAEMEKMFVRMKEDQVRIWANTQYSGDVRRPYGSLNGSREGRKIWGCTITIVQET